jgi:hypothetical protein
MSYVLLKCVKEGRNLRVKMISSAPFSKGLNCQFPRDIREEGLYFVVKSEGVKLLNNFYRVMDKDMIVCKTFDINVVKQYINDLSISDTVIKIKPAVIFGEDDEPECVICLTEIKTTVFSPCGHYITCNECSIRCKTCPMCRGNIVSMLKRSEIK